MPNTLSHEFKAGARVRYTGKAPGWEDARYIGHLGVVKQFNHDNDVVVTWDEAEFTPCKYGVLGKNLELVTEPQAPAVPAGPFFVFPLPKDKPVYQDIKEAEACAFEWAEKFPEVTYIVVQGLKAFKVPTVPQEVSFAA